MIAFIEGDRPVSIGSDSISETSIAEQRDPNSKKTPPGQTAPAALIDPTGPMDLTALTGPTDPTVSN